MGGKPRRLGLPRNFQLHRLGPCAPAVLQLNAGTTQNGDAPAGTNELPDIAGRRVYVRRLRDTRSVDERTYALIANTSSQNSRTPLRDYVLQTSVGVNNVTGIIPTDATVSVLASAPRPAPVGSVRSTIFELTRVNATGAYSKTEYYRPGDRILRDSKHFQCTATGVLGAFDVAEWQEVYVHETDYREDFFKNKQPLIVFDNDTDADDKAAPALATFDGTTDSSWFDDPLISAQLRSGTDTRDVQLLRALASPKATRTRSYPRSSRRPPARTNWSDQRLRQPERRHRL